MHSAATHRGLCCQLSCMQPPSCKVGIDHHIQFQFQIQSACQSCFLLFGHQHPTIPSISNSSAHHSRTQDQPSLQRQQPTSHAMKTLTEKRPSWSHKQIKGRLEHQLSCSPIILTRLPLQGVANTLHTWGPSCEGIKRPGKHLRCPYDMVREPKSRGESTKPGGWTDSHSRNSTGATMRSQYTPTSTNRANSHRRKPTTPPVTLEHHCRVDPNTYR